MTSYIPYKLNHTIKIIKPSLKTPLNETLNTSLNETLNETLNEKFNETLIYKIIIRNFNELIPYHDFLIQ